MLKSKFVKELSLQSRIVSAVFLLKLMLESELFEQSNSVIAVNDSIPVRSAIL